MKVKHVWQTTALTNSIYGGQRGGSQTRLEYNMLYTTCVADKLQKWDGTFDENPPETLDYASRSAAVAATRLS